MNNLKNEDEVSYSIKEIFISSGYKCAYYSPPAGAWSKINFEYKNISYTGFCRGDKKRPDIILYKEIENGLDVLIIESKDSINQLSDDKIESYIEVLCEFSDSLKNYKFRHRIINGISKNWNRKIPLEKMGITIGFGTGGAEEDYTKFKGRLEEIVNKYGKKVNYLSIFIGENDERTKAIMRLSKKGVLKESEIHFSY